MASALRSGIISGDGRAETTSFPLEAAAGRRTGCNTDLQTLVLADNDLTEVSERVGDLSKLRMLDLGHNRLRALPISLGRLEGLSDFLYLHDNRLTQLPDSFSRLQRLRYLNISENAFPVFPRSSPPCGVSLSSASRTIV